MSLTDELHKGMVIRHEATLYSIVDFNTAQTGKQRPTVHVKLRSLRDGHTSERTLDQLGRIEEVPAELREMQFLYASGEQRVFMDTQSFEQYELAEDVLGKSIAFLVEEEKYKFLTIEGRPVSLQLPDALVMEVADTAAVQHAGGSSTVHKEATLTSGMVVQVPLFIKTGDRVRIRTDTRQYLGKEH